MAAVTQKIPNLIGGVSRQPDDKKIPGQVREAINAYADPTYGLHKRPGTEWLRNLTEGPANNEEGKWFYIDRDNAEKYIGVIDNDDIKIWNVADTTATVVVSNEVEEPVKRTPVCVASYMKYPDWGILVYDQNLDLFNEPVKEQYELTYTPTGGTAQTITAHTVEVRGNVVYVMFSAAGSSIFDENYTFKLDYKKTVTGVETKALRSTEGGEAEEFTERDVVNRINATDTTAPTLQRIELEPDYKTVVLFYDELLDETSNIDGSQVKVLVGGTDVSNTITISIDKAKVELVLEDEVRQGEVLQVEYTKTVYITGIPAINETFRDVAGNEAADITKTEVAVPLRDYFTYYGASAKDSLQVLSVQDTTVIVNNKIVVLPQEKPTFTPNTRATFRVLKAEYGAKFEIKAEYKKPDGTEASVTKTFTTKNAEDGSLSNTTNTEVLNVKTILALVKTELNSIRSTLSNDGIDSAAIEELNGVLEWNIGYTVKFTVKGGISGEELVVIQDEANNISELPSQSVQGRVVKINNTVNKEDTYYAEFQAEDGVKGKGVWEECPAPDISQGLIATTMPHQLVNTDVNKFELRTIPWEDRLVGDDTTNSHPSFVRQDSNNNYIGTINQVFFHNNRLGFLTGDSVSMSQSGEYFNLYHVSALTQADNDPIDINCSAQRPATLHAFIPVAQGGVLYSEDQQFLMFADDGILTPKSTVIRTIANYENAVDVKPVDVGTNMIFINKTAGYARVYAMLTRGQENNPDVVDIGRIVSEWIPSGVTDLIASPQNSFFALYGVNSPYVYFFRTYAVGEQSIMQAWFSWRMQGNVQAMFVDGDDVYFVISHNSGYVITKAVLTQSPESSPIVTADGKSLQLCLDQYARPQQVVYDNSTDSLKLYLPYEDVVSQTPVAVIKTLDTSGLVRAVTRGSDGNGAYFQITGDIPTNDGDALDPTDIFVGYRYDFDVHMPRYYFQAGQGDADYTSSLTIARIKLSVGESSEVTFKLKARGRDEWSTVQPAQSADYYISDSLSVDEGVVYTLPIHQKNTNFSLRIFSDSPFPVSLTSMMWEGNYSQRFYRRT